jgi:hypothetical protein
MKFKTELLLVLVYILIIGIVISSGVLNIVSAILLAIGFKEVICIYRKS